MLKTVLLRDAVAETAGNLTAAKTVDAAKTALEAMLSDEAPPAKPEGKLEAKTPASGDEGGTTDLSQTPSVDAQAEAAELETRAKERGVTIEQQQADEATEQTRLEAVKAKTGETFEQIYEREEKEGKPTDLDAAGKPAKTFSQEEVEATVQKRVKNLAKENEDLKRQLAEKPQPVAVASLDVAEQTAQSGLDQADDLMAQLHHDPDGVKEILTQYLGENAAKTDLSPNGMRQILRNAKRGFEKTLGTVAEQRRQETAVRSEVKRLMAEPELAKALPFLADEDAPEHVQYQGLLKTPQLANHPRAEYLAAALVIGFKQLGPLSQQVADRIAGKQPAKTTGKPPVKLRLKSKLPGTGAAGGSGKPNKTTLAAAKAKGDAVAMAEAMDL